MLIESLQSVEQDSAGSDIEWIRDDHGEETTS
jgi:hypothetical protein